MKKQITIFFILIIYLSSWSQNTIKTTTPCNNDVLFKTPGKWFTNYGGMLDNGSEYIPFNKAQVNETVTRMNAVRDILMKIYPEPMGVDAAWHHSIGRGSFGEQVKYVKNSQGEQSPEAKKEKPVAVFGFVCGFFRYMCNPKNAHEIWPGSPGETGTWFTVSTNRIDPIAGIPRTGDPGYSDDLAAVFTVDGYPMRLRHSLDKKLGGFELLITESSYSRYLLIH